MVNGMYVNCSPSHWLAACATGDAGGGMLDEGIGAGGGTSDDVGVGEGGMASFQALTVGVDEFVSSTAGFSGGRPVACNTAATMTATTSASTTSATIQVLSLRLPRGCELPSSVGGVGLEMSAAVCDQRRPSQ